ncbi:hypothetical protein [Paraburkholderia sp. MM5477-R1]|uniref:hypothetical protein n=1 Tax=Paraburkholderia sp. MM5477-R1 TaxID=2991062 RepID=UPI003D197DA5
MSRPKEKARGASAAGELDQNHADRSPRFTSPQALERWFEARIARELERCRSCMTEAEWAERRAWIEEHARASLREAIEQRAARGGL